MSNSMTYDQNPYLPQVQEGSSLRDSMRSWKRAALARIWTIFVVAVLYDANQAPGWGWLSKLTAFVFTMYLFYVALGESCRD